MCNYLILQPATCHDFVMADNSAAIAALEAILATGQSRISIGDTNVQYRTTEEIRKEIARLKATDDATIAAGGVRPRISRISLGRF